MISIDVKLPCPSHLSFLLSSSLSKDDSAGQRQRQGEANGNPSSTSCILPTPRSQEKCPQGQGPSNLIPRRPNNSKKRREHTRKLESLHINLEWNSSAKRPKQMTGHYTPINGRMLQWGILEQVPEDAKSVQGSRLSSATQLTPEKRNIKVQILE